MAKKSKGKQSGKNKRALVRREERRFVSQASTSSMIVYVTAFASALLLGAGAWGYLYAQSLTEDDKLKALPSYLVAGGAVLLGVAIWLGTSSEAPIRVGAPGIAVEKGEVRRMPWWAVEKITFEGGALAVVVTGKDEAGADFVIRLALKTHAEAIGWLVKEALDRVPKRVDIAEETLDKLPAAAEHAGQVIELEPLQVVGRKDAITKKLITYEPDGRVCTRCERVYFKTSVPKKCKCGNSLLGLRPKDGEDDATDDEDEDDGAHSSAKLEAEKPSVTEEASS